jgi:hypothetical protein
VFLPKGSAALGIDWADIEAKYRTLMPNSGLGAERIEASSRADPRFRERAERRAADKIYCGTLIRHPRLESRGIHVDGRD